MKRITIIGKYNATAGIADGQAVKTRIITQELEDRFGTPNVNRIDTYGWERNPIKLLIKSICAVWCSKNVIFMTDEGGIKIFPWLLYISNFARRCSLHYVVVGGWLIHFVEKHPIIKAFLKRFEGIYVETTVMKTALDKMGFSNIVLMPNCKHLEPMARDDILVQNTIPFRFCTFSRVMREKGIDDAVEAVCEVNRRFGRTVCTLDIYGQVDPKQAEWFDTLKKSFSPEVQYCGVVDYARSVDVLKDYFALLFPTEFFTEGIPGTIIDAYAAGIPVVAAQWESFSDVIDHGSTGIGYPFGKQEQLKGIITKLIENPSIIHGMKTNCLDKSYQYLSSNVMDILHSNLSE